MLMHGNIPNQSKNKAPRHNRKSTSFLEITRRSIRSGRFSGDQETEKTCRSGFHSAGKSAGGFDAGKMMIDL